MDQQKQEPYVSELTEKQKNGLYTILDKVREGVLTNEQAEEAMFRFMEACDAEEDEVNPI